MSLRQSAGSWESPQQKTERRLAQWNGAIKIIKSLADAHTGPNFEDCGWRGDHRDVAAVAEHLGHMQPENLQAQVAEAAAWINSERGSLEGRPIVHDLLNHLRRKFPDG